MGIAASSPLQQPCATAGIRGRHAHGGPGAAAAAAAHPLMAAPSPAAPRGRQETLPPRTPAARGSRYASGSDDEARTAQREVRGDESTVEGQWGRVAVARCCVDESRCRGCSGGSRALDRVCRSGRKMGGPWRSGPRPCSSSQLRYRCHMCGSDQLLQGGIRGRPALR